MLETGTLLQNRYRIRRQIGQGGMGAVYVATDERFGSTVAIKETLFADEQYVKASEREARLLNSLRHPALPNVSDHFVEGSTQFIVMEYIAGEDLAEQLEKRGKPFPVADVMVWADQLLDALDFLHNQEIPVIHRDIKPQNLKLTSRNQIVLLDFGLAKGNPSDASHHTAAKSIFGYSPGYASLEQIQGTGTEPRSDLYSLAAALYHLMTGTPPTDALTRAMSVLNERQDPLVPAHKMNPEVPVDVSEVLLKAMALNASLRPTSAGEMRQMLVHSDLEKFVAPDTLAQGGVAAATDIFSQKTRLLGESQPKQSGIKTAVMTGGNSAREPVSVQTRVNAKQTTAAANSGRSVYKIGAAVFGLLLLVGAGIFTLDSIEETPVKQEFIDNPPVNQAISATNVLTENTNTVPNSDSGIETANIVSPAPKQIKKPPVVSAEKKDSPKVQTGSGGKDSSEPLIIDDPEEGKVKIYKDRIETDEAIIESNRIIIKKPGGVKVFGPESEELKNLTPEQRRKLRRLRQMQRAAPKPPKPPPIRQPE